MSDITGLTALVTGGASGIGAATAAMLFSRGADVATLDMNTSIDSRFFTVACDVTDREGVDRAVTAVASEFGGLDILINNAGIGAAGDIEANDDEEWHRVLDVNVVGIVRVCRAAMPYLKRSKYASIVNTSSILATLGLPHRALYSASKGAVASLTRAMAADHVHENIRVNAVTPGTKDTPWVSRLLSSAPDAVAAAEILRARQPMGRLITADEVANAIVYLASPASASTTGTLLVVDGGMSGVHI